MTPRFHSSLHPFGAAESLEQEIAATDAEQDAATRAYWRMFSLRLLAGVALVTVAMLQPGWPVWFGVALGNGLLALFQTMSFYQWRDEARAREVRLAELRGRWKMARLGMPRWQRQ